MSLGIFACGQHTQRRMSPLIVMERVNVVSHFCVKFDNGGPFFPVQSLGLHPRPEGFDHGVVIVVTDSPEAQP
jgi:hypothetical protein